jgi:cephalosporin hydroxylase
MKSSAIFALGAVAGAVALLIAQPRAQQAPAAPATSVIASAAAPARPERDLDEQAVSERIRALWRAQFREREGIWKSTWLGIPALQNPLDVWITQEILHEVKPDVVIETGTFAGGSAALWATLMDQINPDARVITIDIEDRAVAARDLPIVARNVDFLVGSSTAPEIVAEVTRRAAGKRALVILDSLHTREHVREELEAYASLVPVGSYIIVQDTGIGVPAYGVGWPADGVRDFLAKNDDFEVDLTRERFIVTNNAHGFLKRVR